MFILYYKKRMIHLYNWTCIMNTALDEEFHTGGKGWKDLSQNANRKFVQDGHEFVTHLLLLTCLHFPNLLTMSRYYLQSKGFGFFFYKLSPKQLRSFFNMFWEHQKQSINSCIHRLAQEKPRWKDDLHRGVELHSLWAKDGRADF